MLLLHSDIRWSFSELRRVQERKNVVKVELRHLRRSALGLGRTLRIERGTAHGARVILLKPVSDAGAIEGVIAGKLHAL